MTFYDYNKGLQRINNILNQEMDSENRKWIPSESQMTYSNGYTMWVSSIFIDIRDSTTLFANSDRDMVTRIIKSFVSEVIEVLISDDVDEIGIRGDCVYGIYSTPDLQKLYEVLNKAIYINTLMRLLNRQYRKKGFPSLKIGIGLSSSIDLVVKVGRKGSGINDRVWIGKAVSEASNLSKYGNKNGCLPIVMSDIFYRNIMKYEGNDCKKEWFRQITIENGLCYHCDLINTGFNNWIGNNGGF